MVKSKATRDSWQNIKPMPDSKIQLAMERTFNLEEYERLSWGLIPQQMEHKWFIYLEDNWLYLHRSWTGICIFQIHLEEIDHGYKISEVFMNVEPNIILANNSQSQITSLLTMLIDYRLK